MGVLAPGSAQFSKKHLKKLKIAQKGPGGGGPNFIFSHNFYYLIRGPCKNLKPYDNPFCGFEQRYQQEIKKKD
jgi:hypothetical protein